MTHRLASMAILTLLWLGGAGLVPEPALGFTIDRALTRGTPQDPSDDLLDAARWTNVPGSLVEAGVRGLGGGIEYAVANDFCPRLIPRFIDTPAPSCEQLMRALRHAFDRWTEGHPVLRFTDVSGRLQPQLPPPEVSDPWRGFGAEIDLLALSPAEFPQVARLGAWTSFWFLRTGPVGTNRRGLPGNTITSADIIMSPSVCYHLNPELTNRGCNHFESLILHEIGHALALHHPNEQPQRNFDSDGDPTNTIRIDCQEPTQGLRLSPAVDPRAVMNSSLGRPEPVHAALTNDDIGGRNFHYPICPTARAPIGPRALPRGHASGWLAGAFLAALICTSRGYRSTGSRAAT